MGTLGPTAGLMPILGDATSDGSASGRPSAVVVEGGHVGRTIAADFRDDYDVTFVSTAREAVEAAEREDVPAHHADDIDADALRAADAGDASLAVVASDRDHTNLLAAQLLRTTFDVEHVVLRVNDPERVDSLRDLDVEAVCVTNLLVDEVRDQLETAANDLAED